MGVKIINPGLMTTIQDLGRIGYQKYGMPAAGACDPRSAKIANILVGNDEKEAVMECTLMGPSMVFDEDIVIAITGGNMQPKLDGEAIMQYRAIAVKAGQTLTLGMVKTGCRAYIAFAGGLDIPKVMGSYSTSLKAKIGGVEGRKIGPKDEIGFRAPVASYKNLGARAISPEFQPQKVYTLHVIMGPQDDAFTQEGIDTFLNAEYTISKDFDRMGLRTEGNVISHKESADILSDGITFGAVQVPGSGLPIIMLADRQTTGGYTKIATVISHDFRILGQLKSGDKIRFARISLKEAQSLIHSEKEAMRLLRYITQ